MSGSQNAGSTFGLSSGVDASIFGTNQLPDVLGLVRERLQQAASNSDLFAQVFGDKTNTAELQAVRSQWSVGDFSQLPAIQILSAANTNGAFGAYANSNQTIYLSDALFHSGAAPTNSVLGAVGVLVEETFHWLDDRVGVDTQGDEGELGKMLVFGAPMSSTELTRIRQENDRGFITVNGQRTSAELAFDYAGNSLSTARNINIGSSTTTFQDWVGSTDTNDYYRFNLSYNSTLNLSLNGLSADADVQLLNSYGAVIQTSANAGTSVDSILRQLDAGTYYIRVLPYSGSTYYNLNLSAVPDYAGNTLATARNIAVGAGTTTFRDWVGSADTNDYYRFSLANTSNFNLSLNGLSADADVQLLNSSGALIQTSANAGTNVDSIIRQLNAGTYYIRVLPFSGANTNYNLNLSATLFVPPDYAGNSLSTARNIAVGAGTTTFQDWVGSADTNDYYRFSLANTSNFNLSLNGLSADADVQLLNSSGALIQTSANAGTNVDSIIRQLNAGTYYIRVLPFSGANTNYNLNLSAVTIVPPPVPPAPTGDWYSQNLRDSGIASLTRSLAVDGNLSRNDILSIFRNAQDGSVIDSNEQSDFRTLVTNSARFSMANSVRYLSEQVANATSTNMSASLFESSLVGRWFLGTVAPTAIFNDNSSGRTYNFTYTQVQGSLFGGSGQARIGDIDQGRFGDCAFLAALGSTFARQSNDSGNQSSSVINSMIENNGIDSVTGIQSYTMRFYSNGVAQYVTVDNRLATYNGQIFGAARTDALWVPLVERAYAQWREWREGQPGYNLIGNGDNLVRPLEFVTGRTVNTYSASSITFTQLQTALNNGQAIETGRLGSDSTYIVGGHAYSVTNAYTNSNGQQRVVVRNPWGVDGRTTSGANDGFIDLSLDEFRLNFNFGVAIA